MMMWLIDGLVNSLSSRTPKSFVPMLCVQFSSADAAASVDDAESVEAVVDRLKRACCLADQMVGLADVDRASLLPKAEVRDWVASLTHGELEDLRLTFQDFDKDKSGAIDDAELLAALRAASGTAVDADTVAGLLEVRHAFQRFAASVPPSAPPPRRCAAHHVFSVAAVYSCLTPTLTARLTSPSSSR